MTRITDCTFRAYQAGADRRLLQDVAAVLQSVAHAQVRRASGAGTGGDRRGGRGQHLDGQPGAQPPGRGERGDPPPGACGCSRRSRTARAGSARCSGPGSLGLLIPELSNPVFPAFAEALETRAAGRGYSTVLCNTRSASIREEEYVRMLLARGVEGMVFVSPEATDVRGLARPLPAAEGRGRAHGVRQRRDAVAGGAGRRGGRAGRRLPRHPAPGSSSGTGRSASSSGPTRSMPARLKATGWAVALEEAGLPHGVELIEHAPYGPAGGASAMGRLLDGPRPTGVICSSDLMALGAISEAQAARADRAAGPVRGRVRRHPAGGVLHARADHAGAADPGDRPGRGGRAAGRHGEHPGQPVRRTAASSAPAARRPRLTAPPA